MFHNIILLIWSYNVELFHCCLLKIAWFFSPCRDNYKIRPVTGTTRNETCPPHPDSAGQPLHITGHLFTILGKEYNPSLSLGGLPRRLGGKESACGAGDGDEGSTPGSGSCPGGGKGTGSSILARETPWTGRLRPWGRTESDARGGYAAAAWSKQQRALHAASRRERNCGVASSAQSE